MLRTRKPPVRLALGILVLCVAAWFGTALATGRDEAAAQSAALVAPAYWVLQSETQRQEDQFDQLLTRCQAALTVPDDRALHAAAYRFLGEYYEENEKWDDAVVNYRKVLNDYPDSDQASWALLGLGEVMRLKYLNTDGYAEALKTYQRVRDDYPGTEAARWATVRIAKYYTGERDWARAEQYYQAALQEPKPTPTRWTGLAVVSLAEHYRQAGQFATGEEDKPRRLRMAIAQFEKAIREYGVYLGQTHCADAQTKIGTCYRLLDDNAAAVQAYQKVLDNYPGNKWCAEALLGLASIAQEQKRWDDAIVHWKAILRGGYRINATATADYWEPCARCFMAQCYASKGDLERALEE